MWLHFVDKAQTTILRCSYLVEPDANQSVSSRRNREAEIPHLGQLHGGVQEHLEHRGYRTQHTPEHRERESRLEQLHEGVQEHLEHRVQNTAYPQEHTQNTGRFRTWGSSMGACSIRTGAYPRVPEHREGESHLGQLHGV